MGTLVPAPVIMTALPRLVGELKASGQEIGLHAWDHVAWHDRLWREGGPWARRELHRGVEAFTRLTGEPPLGFAAPAWRVNYHALAELERIGVLYTSATRGATPCRPCLHRHVFNVLEIPTTLPTADEIIGRDGITSDRVADYYVKRLRSPGLHVLTIHAEMEGRHLAPAFETLLDRAMDQGVRILPLADLAREILGRSDDVPVMDVIRKEIPGRAGRVSHLRA